MMESKERKRIEVRENTINYLTSKFDTLILGISTKKYGFKEKSEKEKLIKKIKDYISYRIKEKIIDVNSDSWKIILKINKSTLKSKKEIEDIYMRLLKLKHYSRYYSKILRLWHPKSKYYYEKSKELGKERGKKALKEFLKMVEKITKRN